MDVPSRIVSAHCKTLPERSEMMNKTFDLSVEEMWLHINVE